LEMKSELPFLQICARPEAFETSSLLNFTLGSGP